MVTVIGMSDSLHLWGDSSTQSRTLEQLANGGKERYKIPDTVVFGG